MRPQEAPLAPCYAVNILLIRSFHSQGLAACVCVGVAAVTTACFTVLFFSIIFFSGFLIV